MVEIVYGDGASHVVELGIHLRCTIEHQLITDQYHEDELAFHLVCRSVLRPWLVSGILAIMVEVGFAVVVSGEARGSSKIFLAAKDIQIARRNT